MQMDDLVRLYQSKTDEELIHLAAEAEQLTPEAYSLFTAELFRRRIPLDAKPSPEQQPAVEVPLSFGTTWLGKDGAESIDDLVRRYQSKTNDELLQLADEVDQLTPEARSQLRAELFRRRIPTPANLSTTKARTEKGVIPSTASKAWLAKESNQFIAEVLRLYHRNFWTFIKFVAPAVLVGSFAVILGRKINMQIVNEVVRRGTSQYTTEILEMKLINLAALFCSWMVSCFAYSGICSAVRHLEAGSPVSLRGSLLAASRQSWRFLRICILLALLCMLAFAVSALGLSALLWLIARRLRLSSFPLWIISLVVSWAFLVVVSRFALAVPAVVLDDYKVGQSMFRSDELTEGRWLVLAALVCKSYIGGYIAAMSPYWLAGWIPTSVSLPSWFGWFLYAASIAAVTLIEPPMFIGFALLYLRQSAVLPAKAEVQLAPQLG